MATHGRVLIVEHDAVLAGQLACWVRQAQYEVFVVATIHAATHHLRTNADVQGILLDLLVPDIRDLYGIPAFARACDGIPLAVLSGREGMLVMTTRPTTWEAAQVTPDTIATLLEALLAR